MTKRLRETNADDVRGRGAMVAMEFMRDCHKLGILVHFVPGIAQRFYQIQLDQPMGLRQGGLGIEAQPGVHLGRDAAGDDLEDLTAELNEQVFESCIRLLVDSLAILLARGDGRIDQADVFWLLGSGQNQGRVGSGIMGLIFAEGFLG